MKLLIVILALFCSNVSYAARPEATAVSLERVQRIENHLKIRSEIRTDTLALLNINFKDSVPHKISEFLRRSGFAVRDLQVDKQGDVRRGDKYDFIFWQVSTAENLDIHVNNLLGVLRTDGILFIRIKENYRRSDVIDNFVAMGLDVKIENGVVILKRKFEAYELFRSVAQELAQIMAIGKAA